MEKELFCLLPCCAALTNIILIFRAAGKKKSGLGGCEMEDRREDGRGSSSPSLSSDAQYFYLSLPESITNSKTAEEPISHAKPHVELRKTVEKLLGKNSKISTERSRKYCKVNSKNVPFPKLRTVSQLPVSNTIRFLRPRHSIPFTKCKTNNCAVRFQDLWHFSWLNKVSLVADCIHTNITQDAFHY